MLVDLWQDLRFGVRVLVKTLVLASIAIVTMPLGDHRADDAEDSVSQEPDAHARTEGESAGAQSPRCDRPFAARRASQFQGATQERLRGRRRRHLSRSGGCFAIG